MGEVLTQELLSKEKRIRKSQLELFKQRKRTLEDFLKPLNLYLNPFYRVINCSDQASCSILVENQTHPFEGGLVFNATPPGKKFGFGTEGLSSGELTLANLCFFLTINEVLRSPFVVFDESDAHLDVENLKKYASMIKKLREKLQVLFITHKPALFDLPDGLIGVTRAPNHSSRIVSLKT